MAWDLTDFRNILDRYEKMYSEEKDPNIRHELAVNIASIKKEIVSEELIRYDKLLQKQEEYDHAHLNPINRFFKRFQYFKPIDFNIAASYGSIICDVSTAALFKEIYPYLEEFHERVKNVVDYKKRFDGAESKFKFTDEEMLDLVHDMFKSTNKKVYDIYCLLDKKRDKSIKFIPDKPSNQGSHFWFQYIDDRFIEVGKDGDMELSLSTLAHEAGHFVGSVVNEARYNTNGSYDEIESLFFELVAYDYFADTLYKDYYDDAMRSTFERYASDANGILITRNVTDEFFNNFTRVKDPYAYYEALINSNSRFSHMDLFKDVNYTFSYITALELFEIYKEDKDLAIDILFRIMSENRSKSEVSKITDNVDLNSHLDKHIKRLYLGRGGNHGLVQ